MNHVKKGFLPTFFLFVTEFSNHMYRKNAVLNGKQKQMKPLKVCTLIARKSALEKTQLLDVLITDKLYLDTFNKMQMNPTFLIRYEEHTKCKNLAIKLMDKITYHFDTKVTC